MVSAVIPENVFPKTIGSSFTNGFEETFNILLTTLLIIVCFPLVNFRIELAVKLDDLSTIKLTT